MTLSDVQAAEYLAELADVSRAELRALVRDAHDEVRQQALRRRCAALNAGVAALRRTVDDYTSPLVFSALDTAQAVREGRKDVTRRVVSGRSRTGETRHWRPGALAHAYERSPRRGGRPFADLRILSVTRELLSSVTSVDVEREGFPHLTRAQFVDFFLTLHGLSVWPDQVLVDRIEFRVQRLMEVA